MTKQARSQRIAALNDKFRKSLVSGGRTYMTAGVNPPTLNSTTSASTSSLQVEQRPEVTHREAADPLRAGAEMEMLAAQERPDIPAVSMRWRPSSQVRK